MGDRLKNIETSIDLIHKEAGPVILNSTIYVTEPLGFSAELDFLNLCIAIEANCSPLELLEKLKSIEKRLGRHKKSADGVYESRLIDIDIILFGDAIVDTSELSVPHKKYYERMFVLKPLAEIAWNIIDPINNKSIKQLYGECSDQSTINFYNEDFHSNE